MQLARLESQRCLEEDELGIIFKAIGITSKAADRNLWRDPDRDDVPVVLEFFGNWSSLAALRHWDPSVCGCRDFALQMPTGALEALRWRLQAATRHVAYRNGELCASGEMSITYLGFVDRDPRCIPTIGHWDADSKPSVPVIELMYQGCYHECANRACYVCLAVAAGKIRLDLSKEEMVALLRQYAIEKHPSLGSVERTCKRMRVLLFG